MGRRVVGARSAHPRGRRLREVVWSVPTSYTASAAPAQQVHQLQCVPGEVVLSWSAVMLLGVLIWFAVLLRAGLRKERE